MEYAYASLAERIKREWKIYVVSFVFALIAGLIGQIAIPLGPGQIILFPIFYSIILGILSGPEVVKIFNRKEVKAASKIVIIAICPFIVKIGINAGASLDTVVSTGPALFSHAFGDILTIFITLPVALLLGAARAREDPRHPERPRLGPHHQPRHGRGPGAQRHGTGHRRGAL
ncbi:DUF3100 domain-containing protein [Collinsella tanakaei]|uniref:DUF3100 domain-containing protein n=1 Tax=Collinsella tanakaei TaxID=626935 RepID=UPI00195D227D